MTGFNSQERQNRQVVKYESNQKAKRRENVAHEIHHVLVVHEDHRLVHDTTLEKPKNNKVWVFRVQKVISKRLLYHYGDIHGRS